MNTTAAEAAMTTEGLSNDTQPRNKGCCVKMIVKMIDCNADGIEAFFMVKTL